MKNRVLTTLLLFGMLFSHAQNTMLTKAETVNYIQKKLDEAFSHDNGKNSVLVDAGVKISDCNLVYYQQFKNKTSKPTSTIIYSSSDYKEFFETTTFNPRHIVRIEQVQPGGSLGKLRIHFVGKTATNKYYNKEYEMKTRNKRVQTGWDNYGNATWGNSTEYYWSWETNETVTETLSYRDVYFLGSDPTNYDKLRKAFEHLRDLCKAEDDPFGN